MVPWNQGMVPYGTLISGYGTLKSGYGSLNTIPWNQGMGMGLMLPIRWGVHYTYGYPKEEYIKE